MTRHLRLISYLLIAALIPLSFIGTQYVDALFLQHIPTIAGLFALLACSCFIGISNVSFFCLIAFLQRCTFNERVQRNLNAQPIDFRCFFHVVTDGARLVCALRADKLQNTRESIQQNR